MGFRVFDRVFGVRVMLAVLLLAPAVATAQLTEATLPFPEGGTIIVQPGDTLYGVSRRYGLDREAVAELNFLEEPYTLRVGQRLLLPVPRSHRVRPGQTVYRIARRYGVSMRDIIELNGLEPPYLVRPGQSLRLPRPRIHRIETGDTLYNIARRYGVDQSALVRLNELEPPYGIRAGDSLRLPRAATVAERRTPDEEPPERTAAWEGDAEAATSRTGTSSAAIQATLGPPEETDSRFQMPVRGEIISTFGPKQGGLRNDGINIGTEEGATVVAAEAGTVAYAGSELRGFGNLILIRHEGGWITAYAHNARLLVEAGAEVRRGQPIALAGQTGSVDRPQLHFEVRRGRQAVDPQPLL